MPKFYIHPLNPNSLARIWRHVGLAAFLLMFQPLVSLAQEATVGGGANLCGAAVEQIAQEVCAGNEECDLQAMRVSVGQLFACGEGNFDGSCPVGQTACPPASDFRRGNARTCCTSREKCQTYGENAWCYSSSKVNCPADRPVFCEGRYDNACCAPGAGCEISHGYAFCRHNSTSCVDEATPDHPNGTPEHPHRATCGANDCCVGVEGQDWECKSLGFGYKKCDYLKCSGAQVRCSGVKYSICCDPGMCSSSENGNPNCLPPPPTTTTTTTSSTTSTTIPPRRNFEPAIPGADEDGSTPVGASPGGVVEF